MNHSKLIKFEIFSLIFVFAFGTLLHFTYQLSRNNLFVGLFSAVNESTWEHLKLLFFPMLFMSFLGYFVFKKSYYNYLCIKVKSIVLGLIFIVVFFYTYTGIIGTNFAILDIGSFFAAGFLSYYYSYKNIITTKYKRNCFLFTILSIVILFSSFILFTLVPPKIGIFNDPITNTYGIFKLK